MFWIIIITFSTIIILNAIFKSLNNSNKNKELLKVQDDFVKRTQDEMLKLINNKSFSVNDDRPIPMKKDEKLISIIENVSMGVYKRDGRVGYYGLSTRLKIIGGVSLRSFRGKVECGKSWVFEQVGTLYVTTKGFVFNGGTENINIPFSKTLQAISPNGCDLYVDRMTGKDIIFKTNNEITPTLNAIIHAFSAHLIQS